MNAFVKSLSTVVNIRLAVIGLSLAVMCTVFHFASGGLFFSAENLYNLAQQTAVVGIIATAAVLVIVSRNIDLSVGSVLGFVGVIIAWLQYTYVWPWYFACLIGLAVALAISLYHGILTAIVGVPAFIVTLGGLLTFRGGAFLLTSGKTQPVSDPIFLKLGGGIDGAIGVVPSYILAIIVSLFLLFYRYNVYRGHRRYGIKLRVWWLILLQAAIPIIAIFVFVAIMNSYTINGKTEPQGLPIPVIIWAVSAYFIAFIAKRTRFGRYVFAIGGNPEAARLVGIPVRSVTVKLFLLTGLMVTIAAIVSVARLNAGTNSLGTNLELFVIASAVIGGTSLIGGSGSIAGSILGALLMQTLESGMLLLDVDIGVRYAVVGQVLILAAVFDVFYRRKFGED